MPTDHVPTAEKIFARVLEQAPADRAAFVEAACRGDASLRADVVTLLSAHERAGAFLEQPALGLDIARIAADTSALGVGDRIDRYRILGVIATGGMGTVYRAVRDDEHYRQEVAVKLIRRGMANEVAIRRFHQERQTLAQLEHPYITRLIDGGTTADGFPYLSLPGHGIR